MSAADVSAVGSSKERCTLQAVAEGAAVMMEYEAFMAESSASRAEKVKEVEELRDMRSPLSRECHCCRQILCLNLLPRRSGETTKSAAASRRFLVPNRRPQKGTSGRQGGRGAYGEGFRSIHGSICHEPGRRGQRGGGNCRTPKCP